MRYVKRLIPIVLVICVCLSLLSAFCCAAEERSARTLTCQSNNVRFRRSIDDLSDESEIIGHLMKGDQFHTSTAEAARFYYGTPGSATAIYKQFGSVNGYVASGAFNQY